MTPHEEINKFIKETNEFKKIILEKVDIEHFSIIQLLQLIEASKQIIRTSEQIISDLDEHANNK